MLSPVPWGASAEMLGLLDDKRMLLYCERWLEVPVRLPDGTVEERTKGTPQGGVISPLLANLFLNYVYGAFYPSQLRKALRCDCE